MENIEKYRIMKGVVKKMVRETKKRANEEWRGIIAENVKVLRKNMEEGKVV